MKLFNFIIKFKKIENLEDISLEEVSLKAKSKREIYNLIVTSGNIYLPPIQSCNYKFLRELVTGVKKVHSLLV